MKLGDFLGKHEKEQVGFRELFSIVVITLSLKATDMSTVFVFRDGLNAAWMIVICSFLLILPSLFLLNHVLKKYQCKNILEVTQLTLGKPFAFVIAFILLCFTLLNTASDSRSYLTQLTTINFPNTPMFILYLCFLTICAWGAKKGWESVGSIAWAVFPYLMLTIVLLIFLMLKEAHFNRIFPLFGTGMLEVAKASFGYTALFSEPFILAMMYPFVKNHGTYTKSLYTSLLLAVFIMVLFYLSYLCMFDFRSVEKITYPFNEAIRFVNFGRYIMNIETFFITLWLIATVVKFTVYIYIVCKIFGFLFQIKEFEYSIMPITLLILIIAMIPENNEVNMMVIRTSVSTYLKYFLLFLPPLLWVGSKIKEGRMR
jgi:spore germination protein KB